MKNSTGSPSSKKKNLLYCDLWEKRIQINPGHEDKIPSYLQTGFFRPTYKISIDGVQNSSGNRGNGTKTSKKSLSKRLSSKIER